MNYATLLALLAALSFTLPLLVQLGEKAGVSRNSGIAVTLLFVIFLAAWLILRRPLKKQAENGDAVSTSQESEVDHEHPNSNEEIKG
jgi:Ca2+/H+ antiporter